MDPVLDSKPAGTSWLNRTPSWTFLGMLAGYVALGFVLAAALPDTFWHPPDPAFTHQDARCDDPSYPKTGYGFLYDHFWLPILCDEGYNPYNTANLAVILLLLVLWAYRLMAEMREHVNIGLTLAVVPYFIWGSVYRVLEDTDVFAPFDNLRGNLPAPDHAVGNGFLDHSLGVFFITPLIYVEILFIAVALLLWSHRAQRVAEKQGLARGVQYYGLSLLAVVALYTAFWASEPTYIRFVAHPFVALGAALVSFMIVYRWTQRTGRFSAHVGLGAWGVFFLLIGLWYILVWMTGAQDSWKLGAVRTDPDGLDGFDYPLPIVTAIGDWPVQWWVFAAALIGPGLIAYAAWKQGQILGRAPPAMPAPPPSPMAWTSPPPPGGLSEVGGPSAPPAAPPVEPTRPKGSGTIVTVFMLLMVVQALAVFATIVGLRDFAQRQIADAWGVETNRYWSNLALVLAGPAAIFASSSIFRSLAAGGLGTHVDLLHYANPVNLLMIFGQMIDALMTSLGLDLYNYEEKHVLPRALIEAMDGLDLPSPMGDFPTALVMVPLKLLVVLLIVVAVDAAKDPGMKGRENLVGLVKLAIIMVGMSPGVRDAVRLAMAS